MGKIPLVGAILGDWDEEVGPFIVEERMERKLKEKPEVILLKCFSSAQVIFSYDEFNQVSFVIPFLSLGVRAKIYFNLSILSFPSSIKYYNTTVMLSKVILISKIWYLNANILKIKYFCEIL